jgi:hypothetical protein
MVDISGKIAQIKQLVDRRCYFTINRARQYGKTTTLSRLKKALKNEYYVASISFQRIDSEDFATSEKFCQELLSNISRVLKSAGVPAEYADKWQNPAIVSFGMLSNHITEMCENCKVVLMIDEVDEAGDFRVFRDFLAMLREKFLARQDDEDYTFHSVILAGVHDIKNIKLKMISEGTYTPSEGETKRYDSPWNIAVNFKVDMSFSPAEIATMLTEYEKDHNTGMDIASISDEIYDYTSGYPFLVSRICQRIDEKLDKDWTLAGVRGAVHIILEEDNSLFEDISKNLLNNKELYDLMNSILIEGTKVSFVKGDNLIGVGVMYGVIKNVDGKVAVSNKIFEIYISKIIISKEARLGTSKKIPVGKREDYEKDGHFDMELCLRKFAEHYPQVFSGEKFSEYQGRNIFLIYLLSVVNGQGYYYLESQLADHRRMDLVVDYERDQFIVEIKIWYGDKRHEDACSQLAGYLESKKEDTGYLLTYDFRKEHNKQPKAEWVEYNGKRIFDVMV